ncbi:MAG: formylglycine-generating enzyme family protein [Dysgonamonadaceae bacterium]|nr:formylglycine-generating enzyme family protein [Dysgonamonadaceae bacterium]
MKRTFFIIFSTLCLCIADRAEAQVTIGSLDDPQSFSILELIGGGTRGFRLPQMNTCERDALNVTGNDDARGLEIFNLSTECVDTWNGTKWIETCYPKSLKPEMIEVVGGSFTIGERLQTYTTKDPNSYTVTISTFNMSKTEVTQAQFEYVMGTNPSYFQCGNSSYRSHVQARATSVLPVEGVNWYDAIAYCNKLSIKENKTPCYTVQGVDFDTLTYKGIPHDDTQTNAIWDAAKCNFDNNGYRLPTEAEWEYAARSGLQSYSKQNSDSYDYDYSGSNNICEVAWYEGNNKTDDACANPFLNTYGTKPVATKKANQLGLYDMSGNVWEWCWDWYGSYKTDKTADPTGGSETNKRVLRGGRWIYDATRCFVSFRHSDSPNLRFDRVGFRVVCR